MPRLQPRSLPQRSTHHLAAMCLQLACVGALCVALEVRAQTCPPRLGALPFVRDTLTTEAAPPLDGAPDIQPPVGFAPQLRGGRERFPLVAAAESHADGAGSGTPSDEPANTAELAKKLQNPVTDLITVPMQHNWDLGIGPADAMRSRNCCLSLALSPLRKGHARFRTMCTCTSSQCRNGSSAVADSYKRKRAQLRVSKMSP